MPRRTGSADLPLHGGHVPSWLVGPARSVKNAWAGDKESPTWTQAGLN